MPPVEPTSRKYQNFSTTPGDNDAAPPTGAPENNDPDTVNDIQRYDKAAIAELAVDVGLATAEHGLTDQAIGWQPMNDVEFTGGNVSGLSTLTMAAGYSPGSPKAVTSKDYVDQQLGAGGLPVNSIIMWWGTVAQIPSGWQLCNGTNGTPDLRNVFPYGATGDGDQGISGGAATDESTSAGLHNHDGMLVNGTALTTAQMPIHTHTSGTLATDTEADHDHLMFRPGETLVESALSDISAPYEQYGGGTENAKKYKMSDGGQTGAATVGETSLGGSHSHGMTGSTASAGSSQSHGHTLSYESDGAHTHTVDTIPPYTKIMFIMRIS